jgi:hypothetical protein
LDVGVWKKPRKKVPKLGVVQFVPIFDYHHPISHWVERMTVNYLRSHGGVAEKQDKTWNLTLPTGEQLNHVVFTSTEAAMLLKNN